MLRYVIQRELFDHLKSHRFLASFVMTVILFTVSAIFFIPEYREQERDYSRNRAEMRHMVSELAEGRIGIYRAFSFNFEGAWIFKKPNRLAFIAEGHDRDLPNAFQPSAFRVYGPAKQERSNLLLWRNEALDWSFIVGVIFSFFAFVFVYDAVSGDRENGTLRLTLSHPVSRATLLVGKFLGAFICLGSVMIVGMLLSLLTVAVLGGIGFGAADLATVAAVMALSLGCLAAFLMLGLFISGITRESAASLVVALLCWALLVVVIPRSGGFVAKHRIAIPAMNTARETANTAESDARKSYETRHPESAGAGWSGHWSPGEALGPALAACDAWSASFDGYRNTMIRQVESARVFTLFSPYSAYLMSLESLTGSGIVHYRRFFEQVRDFRLTMRQALLGVYPRALNEYGWEKTPGYLKSIEPLNPALVPEFEERPVPFAGAMTAALPGSLIIALCIAVFFAAAFAGFLRYDIR